MGPLGCLLRTATREGKRRRGGGVAPGTRPPRWGRRADGQADGRCGVMVWVGKEGPEGPSSHGSTLWMGGCFLLEMFQLRITFLVSRSGGISSVWGESGPPKPAGEAASWPRGCLSSRSLVHSGEAASQTMLLCRFALR